MFDSLFENLCTWNDEQWQLYTDNASYEAWLDAQPESLPLPQDCDPNYQDDFQILIGLSHGSDRCLPEQNLFTLYQNND